jgi:1,4-alpha-glucan branching enzyme
MVKKTPIRGTDKVSVTFEVSPEAPVRSVHLAGEFNDWDPAVCAMKQRKDGAWAITLRLPKARAYAYRYVVDGRQWLTDDQADHTAPDGFGGANAVVILN